MALGECVPVCNVSSSLCNNIAKCYPSFLRGYAMTNKYFEIKKINGFKIIKQLGIINGSRRVIVICKRCKKEFETNFHSLQKIKSCGCLNVIQIIKPGTILNGFKILKDFGWNKETRKRRVTLECKVCKREYENELHKVKLLKHCGCMIKDRPVCKYRHTYPRLLRIYGQIRKRCYNAENKDYKYWGGKGITVCKEWLLHPDNFCEWALKNGYKNSLSIDRIDNDKG